MSVTNETRPVAPHMEFATVRSMMEVKNSVDELTKDLKELRVWLVGHVDSNGKPVPGVLQTIDVLKSARKWILTLLSAIAVSSIVNTTAALLGHVIKP
jgi:hypothetical protein